MIERIRILRGKQCGWDARQIIMWFQNHRRYLQKDTWIQGGIGLWLGYSGWLSLYQAQDSGVSLARCNGGGFPEMVARKFPEPNNDFVLRFQRNDQRSRCSGSTHRVSMDAASLRFTGASGSKQPSPLPCITPALASSMMASQAG